MNVLPGGYSSSNYLFLLILGEIFGLLSVILIGLIFHEKFFAKTYDWENFPFSYHPLMMTIGLFFCYGNAILVYRTFKQVPKYSVKIAHAILLIVSLLFTILGFVAIIRQKELNKSYHFLTFHSWLGLATMICFVLQWICGFVSFLFPQLSLDIRKAYMPSHRLWGKILFISAVITILTGLCEHGMTSSFFTTGDVQQPRRLVMNCFGIFALLFTLIVVYLLSNDEYQRLPNQPVEPVTHNMES